MMQDGRIWLARGRSGFGSTSASSIVPISVFDAAYTRRGHCIIVFEPRAKGRVGCSASSSGDRTWITFCRSGPALEN